MRIFLFIICLWVSMFSQALENRNSHFCKLSIKEGLAGENVYKIYKDRNGMMWFGTSNGINLFNGTSLKTYRVSAERQYNDVIDIAQTADRNLYFTTIHGVYRINYSTDAVERVLLSIDGMTSAIETIGNTLYIGSEKGLFVYDGRKTTHFLLNRDNLSDRNSVRALVLDNRKRAWMATEYDLYMFDSRSRKIFCANIRTKISFTSKLHTIAVTERYVYIGTTNSGIIRYDIKTGKAAKYINLNCEVINSLSTDGKYLYVATDGNGAHIVSLAVDRVVRSFTRSTFPRLADNTIYDYYHDASGVDWFGLFQLGVEYSYYNKNLFNTYRFGKFDTSDLIVRSFCINGPQKVIGTRDGLYFVDEARNIVRYFSAESLGGRIVTSISYYHSSYYISTYDGGMSVLDQTGTKLVPLAISEEMREGSFGKSLVSPDNHLWIGSNMGLFVYDGQKNVVTKYDNKNSQLSEGFISDLLFDNRHRCWICSKSGIFLYNSYISSSSFPSGFLNDKKAQRCALGRNGDIFFYSEGGLFVTNENMTHFGKVDLLSKVGTENVDCVVYDRGNGYWVNTDRGMFLFDFAFNHFIYFGSDYGLDDVQISSKWGYIDRAGKLWMGSTSGLIYADISKMKVWNSLSFDIIPYNIRINDHQLPISEENTFIRDRHVNLSWNLGSESLTFMPLLSNYGKPGGRYFEYRIDGAPWQLIYENQSVACGRLGLGRHYLLIRLAHNDTVTRYEIDVYPSMLFIIEFLVVITLILFGWMVLTKRLAVNVKVKPKGNEKEERELLARLEEYIRLERPYLNQSLKLSDLSTSMGCSTFTLSQVLKNRANTSYYTFINAYRIDEFKRFVEKKMVKKDNVTEIAEKCGFRRSSFFATFKKFEGMTPTEYLKKHSSI